MWQSMPTVFSLGMWKDQYFKPVLGKATYLRLLYARKDTTSKTNKQKKTHIMSGYKAILMSSLNKAHGWCLSWGFYCFNEAR